MGDITSHLDILNGTAKTIDFGESYRLVLSYYNNTPMGLEGADINILSITPSTGLTTSTIVDEGGGFYSITLDAESIDTYSIIFSANLTNHQTQFATFTLVSNPIPTMYPHQCIPFYKLWAIALTTSAFPIIPTIFSPCITGRR